MAGLEADPVSDMVLTFYLGAVAVEFNQYAAYVQRRTATQAAQLIRHADDDFVDCGSDTVADLLTVPTLP